MSKPQPHVTINTATTDNWAVILGAVLQGIEITGPFIIELIEASKGEAATVSFNGPPKSGA